MVLLRAGLVRVMNNDERLVLRGGRGRPCLYPASRMEITWPAQLSLLEIDETAPTHHQDNTLKINGIL